MSTVLTPTKLPDILSCQAEAKRFTLSLTLFRVSFQRFPDAQIFIYKRLLISGSRKYFVDGMAKEQQNV